jgi:hypothetical protein
VSVQVGRERTRESMTNIEISLLHCTNDVEERLEHCKQAHTRILM